jgi:hypothetical protein
MASHFNFMEGEETCFSEIMGECRGNFQVIVCGTCVVLSHELNESFLVFYDENNFRENSGFYFN